MTTFVPNAALDIARWVGQRQYSFTFELLDGPTGVSRGYVHPRRDVGSVITHDTTRTIKRTVTLEFERDDTTLIDTIRDRIKICMLVGGAAYPLGTYMFIDGTAQVTTAGRMGLMQLVDEMFIIDQPLDDSFSALPGQPDTTDAVGENVATVIKRLLLRYPLIRSVVVESTAGRTIGSWPAGTAGSKTLNDLTLDGFYWPAWFDNMGTLRVVQSWDPATATPQFDWDENQQVIRNSVVRSDNLLSSPNRFVVISNALPSEAQANPDPIIGRYVLPASAPHAFANRGFYITVTQDIQVSSSFQAYQAAKALSVRNYPFEKAEMQTLIDPRHDGFDVIKWDDEYWLETAWTIPLSENGDMSHTLQKVYS